MRHLPADKYNIAWFKLAEFVVRGEKERALGMYRLLIHSIDDKALSLQLEGDLLLSFNDKSAQEKYRAAAVLYKQENRLRESLCVYDRLTDNGICTNDDLRIIIELCSLLKYSARLATHLQQLSERFIGSQLCDQAFTLLQSYKHVLSPTQIATLYHGLIKLLAQYHPHLTQLYVTSCVTALTAEPNCAALQPFLLALEITHPALHEYACLLLEQS